MTIVSVAVMADEPASWTRLLGNNADGVAVTEWDFNWTQQPSLLWSLPVGDGYGLGAVWGNEYYQADAIQNASATLSRLRCIDLQTGSVKADESRVLSYRDMYGYEVGPRATPTLDEDYVFTLGVSGELVCRDRRTLQTRWVVNTKKKYGVIQNFFGVGSSPLLLGDWVIVMVGGSPAESQTLPPGQLDRVDPNGSLLVAFDKKTGEERWKSGNDLASYSSPRTVVIDGKTFVLAFARSGLVCIDARVGKVAWKYDHRAGIVESVNAMMPVVFGDEVFVSECYQVGSVLLKASPDKADALWKDPAKNRRKQAMRVHWSTPVLVNGYLYGCSGRNAVDSDFRCVEWSTGEVMWVDERRSRSSVTRVGEALLVLDESGGMQVIRADPTKLNVISEWDFSGDDGGTVALSYPCWAAPIVVGDKMLIRGDQNVLCFSLNPMETGP
ncbi:PQQ-binding-like beta-propeller repeat protein [Novipirellula herctigrandis]|uniref:outer membrane protein assembly factor BamB family protein n=1 Tax=Novipirellula herctigrandis TaxID=2527986 RepID=UPI003AF33AF6